MNKVRISGILLFISGILLFVFYDNDGIDFAFGFLTALGLILAITGKLRKTYPKKT